MNNPNLEPANFKRAYEYLQECYDNKEAVAWTDVAEDADLMSDLMLLRVMHNVLHEDDL